MEERSTFIRKLPIPMEIKERYPLTKSVTKIKLERDEEIAKVFKGESDKFLLIIGFYWLASPVASHLLVRLEVTTNPHLEKEMEVRR